MACGPERGGGGVPVKKGRDWTEEGGGGRGYLCDFTKFLTTSS